MDMKLNASQQKMVLENMGLVYCVVWEKFKVTPASLEYEDLVSIGTIGLIKAVINFDRSKATFSTFAYNCIYNNICVHFKKSNKYADDISLSYKKDESDSELIDRIEKYDDSFVDELANIDDFIQVVNIVLNYLELREKLIILYWMGNISQLNIAKLLNISEANISRIKLEAFKEIQRVFKYKISYKKVFSMDIIGNTYEITFSQKDISNFVRAFAKLQNLTPIDPELNQFKIILREDIIKIKTLAHPDYFQLIGQIMENLEIRKN